MTEMKHRFLRAERIGWVGFTINIAIAMIIASPWGSLNLLAALYILSAIDSLYDRWQGMIDAGVVE
jgi:hypothetical protein